MLNSTQPSSARRSPRTGDGCRAASIGMAMGATMKLMRRIFCMTGPPGARRAAARSYTTNRQSLRRRMTEHAGPGDGGLSCYHDDRIPAAVTELYSASRDRRRDASPPIPESRVVSNVFSSVPFLESLGTARFPRGRWSIETVGLGEHRFRVLVVGRQPVTSVPWLDFLEPLGPGDGPRKADRRVGYVPRAALESIPAAEWPAAAARTPAPLPSPY